MLFTDRGSSQNKSQMAQGRAQKAASTANGHTSLERPESHGSLDLQAFRVSRYVWRVPQRNLGFAGDE